MQSLKKIFIRLLFSQIFVQLLVAGTTGKIAGTVIDEESGKPLAGANVIVQGTSMGASANIQGNYTILQVSPGVYTVDVDFIGYTKVSVSDVRVLIDQTSTVNFILKTEAIAGEIVTVIAEKHIVKKDVATSMVAVSSNEIESLPVSRVDGVIGLQAGVRTSFQNGIQIRGGQQEETLFLVDGVTYRDPRNNFPITGIALSSIQEISMERGGFNAEYGQVRSGIINVVTKEGSKTGYHSTITLRARPPATKFFGISPFDRNSMWLRPYLDNDVCWTGTDNGVWDKYTQKQYPGFDGWNAVSERLLADDDPNNDLTPLAAQRKFIWQHRKMPVTDQPDYNIDVGFGGPVPFISKKLGNLRFFTSYRKEREVLVVPLTRNDYVDYDWSLQLTSDLSKSMKLNISAVAGKIFTMSANWDAPDFESSKYLRSPSDIVGLFGDVYFRLFSTGNYSPTDIQHKIYAAKLTHTVNPSTFYEVSLEHLRRDYLTRPPALRDTTQQYEITPEYFIDEALYGFWWGGHLARARDSSKISSTTFKANLVSQINFNNLVKAGIELITYNLNVNYGFVSSFSGKDVEENYIRMRQFPIQGAFYLQDKLEVREFIMNIGLRLDYTNSNTDWVDLGLYDDSFFSSKYDENAEYPTKKSKAQWSLSPRLGISHPITDNSKLFFNYGHFKQLPIYQELFRIGRSANGKVEHFGNPDLTLAKTTAYELGYDHALFNDYLIQLSAFYRDISDQRNQTHYQSASGLVSYRQITSNSYEDIRGFELTLRKSRGRYLTGFANYTYQVSTSGHFGHEEMFESPSKQKEYNEQTTDLYQERPIPTPYARAYFTLHIPSDFNLFTVKGVNPLRRFEINLRVDWSAGWWTTYNPKNLTFIENNVQVKDYFNIELRLNKTFTFHKMRVEAFMEVDNLLNTKRLNFSPNLGSFYDFEDRDAYFKSLHLSESMEYDNIVGDDRIGEYREENVDYQPIEFYNALFETGDLGVIYYDRTNTKYIEYTDGAWVDVDEKRMNKILETKAYIDMPNMTSFRFLNPQQFLFGIRISYDLR